uniref:P63-like transcription factor isoform X2 n=1 Tax=Saccoglossus kowalevskii TaxID=10224 RepID=A0ABM0M4Z7_SACKO|nr:PREDICTED: p63-like transcription factor isoform X2 [Saccoglossus kowalevskii]
MSQEEAECMTPPSGSSLLHDKSFDRSISQGSDRLSQSQPLSQETFNQLWTTLGDITDNGNLTQIVTQPLDFSFSETGVADLDIHENRIEMEVERYQIGPEGTITSLAPVSSSSSNPYSSPDSAMPSSVPSDYSTDHGVTPPPYTPPPQMMASTPTVPSNTDYMGDYGFEISMASSQTLSKTATWTYSDLVKKLYVRMGVTCPIKFKTHTRPPPGSIIRAMPVFKRPEHVKEVVKRCPNHASTKENNEGHPAPAHLLRCENVQAQYAEDHTTGRQSVVVPYENPQVGTEYITCLYAFMCFSSCVGGLNRRPIQVIFQMEKDGLVLGRRVLDVRICACPGRDRKSDEKRCHPPPKQMKRGFSKTAGFQMMSVGTKKRKGDDDVYTLTVRGRENYEILLKIKESLELMSYIPQNTVNQYRAQQHRQGSHPSLSRTSTYPSHGSINNGLPPINSFAPRHDARYHNENGGGFDETDSGIALPPPPALTNGPTMMESQGFSHQSVMSQADTSPTHQMPSNAICFSQSSIQDMTINGWLSKFGCENYSEIFRKKGYLFIHQLDAITIEDLDDMKISPRQKDKIWKGIIDHRAADNFSSTPSMMRTGSNASTVSLHSQSGENHQQVYHATRFTLKQVLSVKLEKDKDTSPCKEGMKEDMEDGDTPRRMTLRDRNIKH